MTVALPHGGERVRRPWDLWEYRRRAARMPLRPAVGTMNGLFTRQAVPPKVDRSPTSAARHGTDERQRHRAAERRTSAL